MAYENKFVGLSSVTSHDLEILRYELEYGWKYMVTSIVIKKVDEMTKILSDKFNQYGHDGWELVQYNLIPPSALITASTIPCCGSIYILATFKKRLEK